MKLNKNITILVNICLSELQTSEISISEMNACFSCLFGDS